MVAIVGSKAPIAHFKDSENGKYEKTRPSIIFCRPDHSAEGAEKSGNSVRSARRVYYSHGTVLRTQPLPGAEVRPRVLRIADRWRGQESVFSELQGIARNAVRNTGCGIGVRRQWPRVPCSTG